MKRFLKGLFLPITRLAAIYLVEIAITANILMYVSGKYSGKAYWFDLALNVMRVIPIACLIFVILSHRIEQAYKANWVIVLVLSPSFGGLIYLLLAKEKPFLKRLQKTHRLRKKYEKCSLLRENDDSKSLRKNISEKARPYSKIANYLSNEHSFNIFSQTKPKFFASKEDGWSDALQAMRNANESIFMEYYILSEGRLLDQIFEIAEKKVSDGVDVRMLYDDFGSFGKIRRKTIRRFRKAGIGIHEFNRVKILVSQELNYRNHRKLMIIDGKTVYAGGANLADEYAEKENKSLGYWFDTIIRLDGDAANDAVAIFKQDWIFSAGRNAKPIEEHAGRIGIPDARIESAESGMQNGACQLYASSPLGHDSVSKDVFLSLLMQSSKSFHIITPYLILNEDVMEKLSFCAKSGLDIKIVVPGIPDKKSIYSSTKSHFSELISSGVKVYKYKKGFIHSKIMLSDDNCASIGSVNIDYRSFFLNFENGILLYDSPEIKRISETISDILRDSEKVEYEKPSIFARTFSIFLKFISPML